MHGVFNMGCDGFYEEIIMGINITTLTFYIILPVLIASGLTLYYYLHNRDIKKRRVNSTIGAEANTQEQLGGESVTEPLYVLLYDSEMGTWKEEELAGNIIDDILHTWKSLGRQWDEKGKKLFHINKYKLINDVKYHYRPIEALMSETRDNPPEDIHGCFDIQDPVSIWYSVKENTNALAKWGAILWFCGITIFLMFILITHIIKG